MIGKILLGFCVGLSLLAQAGDLPTLFTDSAPVLTAADKCKSKVTLTVTHPTATEFSIKVLFQDDDMTQPSEGRIPHSTWTKIGPGAWTCQVKIPGDTNAFSVAVAGSTNWSNSKPVYP